MRQATGAPIYNAIRSELCGEMDRAASSFVYSSWIPGKIWPLPYDKIYDCLGDGQDPGQWNIARWFYGLIPAKIAVQSHTDADEHNEMLRILCP
jgi:hypothetical protein